MNMNETPTEQHILQFRQWLLENREDVLKFLRKVRSVRYFIVMVSIGFGIFIWGGTDITLIAKAILTGCLLVIAALSRKVSYLASGAKHFTSIPQIEEESREYCLAQLAPLLSGNQRLLKRREISKMISNSKRKKFDIYHYLNGMVILSDSVKEDLEEAETSM